MRPIVLSLFGLLLVAACGHPAVGHPHEDTGDVCVPAGQWRTPSSDTPVAHDGLISEMAGRPIVLLGETHTNPEHHRWQLHTIAALHGRNPNMVLSFEAFPRRVQPVLDRWVRGELNDADFLKETDWFQVWRFNPGLYMPLFHFARQHRIPMVALNVGRELIELVRKDGWKGVSVDAREGVGDPAPPTPAFLRYHAKVYAEHENREGDHGSTEKAKELVIPELDDPDYLKFVAAMQTWDRAMAEGLATARRTDGQPLVVGIIGRGHLHYGFGIAHQLTDLGITGAAVLLPWDPDDPCDDLALADGPSVADVVFGVDAPRALPTRPGPLLGVRIRDDDGGIRIIQVVEGSVAETAGLAKDDLILHAAGLDITKTTELIAIVKRQSPGTWLPLKIKRSDEVMEIVAKFPSSG
jgi:uncharacterized iron-regulated protein